MPRLGIERPCPVPAQAWGRVETCGRRFWPRGSPVREGPQVSRTPGHSRKPLGRAIDGSRCPLDFMSAPAATLPNLDIVLDVPVNLTVELGSCLMPMREVLQLSVGSVVQLDKIADEPVQLSVNRKLVARGEVVVVENRFGIKITELVTSAVKG